MSNHDSDAENELRRITAVTEEEANAGSAGDMARYLRVLTENAIFMPPNLQTKEAGDSKDDVSRQPHERRQQSDVPIHRPEQRIQYRCDRNIESDMQELAREADPEQELVGHNVAGGGHSVCGHDES